MVPKCKACGVGKALVDSTKRHPSGLTVQYRRCSACGYRSSTRRWAGVSFTIDELIANLVTSGNVLDKAGEQRVFLVATKGDLSTIELVEITNELKQEHE